jgi:hypothetical protein
MSTITLASCDKRIFPERTTNFSFHRGDRSRGDPSDRIRDKPVQEEWTGGAKKELGAVRLAYRKNPLNLLISLIHIAFGYGPYPFSSVHLHNGKELFQEVPILRRSAKELKYSAERVFKARRANLAKSSSRLPVKTGNGPGEKFCVWMA